MADDDDDDDDDDSDRVIPWTALASSQSKTWKKSKIRSRFVQKVK